MKALQPNLDFIYENHPSVSGTSCFYCNEYAHTIDHVPAVSIVRFYPQYKRYKVKCCSTCNSILGNSFLNTFKSRCEFLIKRYTKRFARLINMPIWEREEIEELKGSLSKYIKIEQRNKILALDKINYLKNLLSELEKEM